MRTWISGLFMMLPMGLGAGCMPTQGEARLPRSSAELTPPVALANSQLLREPSPPMAAEEPAPTSRPRLSQTLTLGSPTSAYQDRGLPFAQGAPYANQTTVIVNNYITQQQTAVGGLGGYGYGYGQGYGQGVAVPGHDGYARSVTAPAQSMPKVGGDWPRPPSYGPAPLR